MTSTAPAAIAIDDADDPRIAAYRDIRERDLVGRQGRFVAEGKVVLDVLFSAGRFEAELALILDSRLAGMAATLAKAPAGMPVYVASRPVMDAVAGFPMHRGVLAIGRRRDDETPRSPACRPAARALVIALVGISNHDNMGAIFRNAAAFGADAVLLDETCCDPLYRKAIRVSVGAALKVPFAVRRYRTTVSPSSSTRTASARWRCRRAARSISARPSGANGWRSISGPKAKACRPICWRGCETVRIPIAARFRQPQRRRRFGDRAARDQEQSSE